VSLFFAAISLHELPILINNLLFILINIIIFNLFYFLASMLSDFKQGLILYSNDSYMSNMSHTYI
jgi:hypothetical protein